MDHLFNPVRPYAWGSTTAIPELLGVPATGQPQAEMWMGAHPGAPSHIDRGHGPAALDTIIDADPSAELGTPTVDRFGPRLPFLLKLLAADSPLSLQVHPDLEQAKAGYAGEEDRGIPADAPHRNYKDANHKPEMIVALTPFEGLCGFRAPAEAADLLEDLGVDALKPYAATLRAHPQQQALREILTAVLTADRDTVAECVAATAESAGRLAAAGHQPYAAAYAAYASIARNYPGDPGVIAAMLLNHVRLQPGEALYLGAGVPHAYLDGLGVEIMANSDNVLRCGLTPKHVDVPELLRIVRFETTSPGVLRPRPLPDGEELYDTPAEEFRLSRYLLTSPAPGAPDDPDRSTGASAPSAAPAGPAPRRLGARAAQILLCTHGTAHLAATTGVGPARITLTPGRSAYVPAGESVELTGDGTVFRATVAV